MIPLADLDRLLTTLERVAPQVKGAALLHEFEEARAMVRTWRCEAIEEKAEVGR